MLLKYRLGLTGAVYGSATEIVSGTIQFLTIRSPHSIMTILSKDQNGKVTQWMAEWIAASNLTKDGVDATTLKSSDSVTVSGAPGRAAGKPKLLMTSIVRPSDGWKWDIKIEQPSAPTAVVTALSR